VLRVVVALGGECVCESTSICDRVGLGYPQIALGGYVVTGRDQEDPRLPDVCEGLRERGVVAPADDGVHVALDHRLVDLAQVVAVGGGLTGNDVVDAAPFGGLSTAPRHRLHVVSVLSDEGDRVLPVSCAARGKKRRERGHGRESGEPGTDQVAPTKRSRPTT